MSEEKKLKDFLKKNRMYTEAEYQKMSYSEMVQLHKERPEEYERLQHRGIPVMKTNGVIWSSQIRKD